MTLTRGTAVERRSSATEATASAATAGPGSDDAATTRWLNEATVVARAQDGDTASFETLVRRHQPSVFWLAQGMLNDRSDAEDIVQDTFVLAWRRLPTLSDPTLFRAWILRIATRQCLNLMRHQSRHPGVPLEAQDLELAASHRAVDAQSDPAAVTVQTAQLDGLSAVLDTLSGEQRACWVLREVNELSYVDIAYATNLSVPTVRGRIARARQNLAKGMAAWR